jgi:hypothetical protein
MYPDPMDINRKPIQGSNFLPPVLTMDGKKQQRCTPSLEAKNVMALGRQSRHCQANLSKSCSQSSAARNGAEGRFSPEF